MAPATLRGSAASGMARQGMSISSGASTDNFGLARRWQQWQQHQRDRRRAAAMAATAAPARPPRRDRAVVAAAATTTTTTVNPPPPALQGGARLTAAIKATRDPQQLLELLRRADASVAATSTTAAASSPLNALHAAAALTHCAQLLVAAEAEVAPGFWRDERRQRPAGGGRRAFDTDKSAAAAAAAPVLLALATAHAARFTPRQCANVMWAVARLGWLGDDDCQSPARRLLAALGARLDGEGGGGGNSPLWPELQPQELVMVLEAAAAAAASTMPSDLVLPWLRGCLSALRQAAPTMMLGAREHCSVAGALARLLVSSSPGSPIHTRAFRSFTPLVLEPALRGAWMYGPRDVASLLQALSLAAAASAASGGGFRPPAAWVAAFLRAATDSADARRAAEAEAHGIGRGAGDDDEGDDQQQQQRNNDARATAAALLALARLGFLPPRAWLASRLRGLGSRSALRALGTGGLALLGYAVARSGVRPPEAWISAWLRATPAAWRGVGGGVEDETSPHQRQPTAQEAAMTAWTLAKLRARPPEAWMSELAVGAARAVSRDAAPAAAACLASSTLLWAFGRMGYRPSATVLCALYRGLLISSSSSPSARCLAMGLGAAARLSSPSPSSSILTPSALTAWLRAAAASRMCDVDAVDAETRRARAVGAWALAALGGWAVAPGAWRRVFLTAAAAGVLGEGDRLEEEDDESYDEDTDDNRLQDAAALAWAAARPVGEGEGDGEAAAAVVLAALREARRALATSDGGRGSLRSDSRSAARRRASAVLLCVWSGAKLAQGQAARAAAAVAAASSEGDEGEAAAAATRALLSALRLRRATVATMRALVADADGCARVLRSAGASSSLASRAARATALLRSATGAAAAAGASRTSLAPRVPAEWFDLMRRQQQTRRSRARRRPNKPSSSSLLPAEPR